MRYVPIEQVKEGQVLASSIYGANIEVLLGEGLTLNNYHIEKINRLGYAGVYILDDLSAQVQVQDLVPTGVRVNLVKSAKMLWQQAEKANRQKQMVKKTKREQSDIIMPTIDALIDHPTRLVELVDLKSEDDYLYYHAANVVILSLLIGVELGLSGVRLVELGMSALLHDVGNIFIPKTILEKPGKLTPEEYGIIQSHTEKGFEYLRDSFDISIEGCMGAQHHHENFDGSGYPTGLKGDRISTFGKIIAIADVYDALTSRRPFRRMLYPPAAMDYMNKQAGKMFDPRLLEIFQRSVSLYPSGMCVELDSGVRGIVVKNYPGAPDRPRIRLFSNAGSEVYVDLHEDNQFKQAQVAQIIDCL